MSNPIKYYHHVLGPWRKILRSLWDSEGRECNLLVCGHVVPGAYRGVKAKRVKRRRCMLCNKRKPPAEVVKKLGHIESVIAQQAILEGKRRRAVLYFKERGKEIPVRLQKRLYLWALYDDPSKVILED